MCWIIRFFFARSALKYCDKNLFLRLCAAMVIIYFNAFSEEKKSVDRKVTIWGLNRLFFIIIHPLLLASPFPIAFIINKNLSFSVCAFYAPMFLWQKNLLQCRYKTRIFGLQWSDSHQSSPPPSKSKARNQLCHGCTRIDLR